jgi:glycosyltransferase involved in cell wall biosynthesis
MKNIKTLLKLMRYRLFSFFSILTSGGDIKCVHTITFRLFSPNGGRGGGSAVQSCQNILLGEEYKNLILKYTYIEENSYSKNVQSRLADLFGAAYFAIYKTKNENGCVYITHDYGTAFGLALLRKKFVYVSHLQGPRVEEKHNYGEVFTNTDASIVNFCERYVFKKAMYVCFPSHGAREYYFESKYRSIDKNKSKIGPVLYNTVYANPQNESVEGVIKEDNIITILSVGALLPAKGLDFAPDYIDNLLMHNSIPIRWIVVGSGHLKDFILDKAQKLELKHNNFQFIFHEQLSYPQIRYLNSICDIYLMIHRVSIFDLATLEAMKEGKMVILSPVSGNNDFNKEDNIIFSNSKIPRLNKEVITTYGDKNRCVYQKYFSTDEFIKSYHSVISDLL